MSWINTSGEATMSRVGLTFGVKFNYDPKVINKWIVRNNKGKIICMDKDYDVALAVWHRERDKADDGFQLNLF